MKLPKLLQLPDTLDPDDRRRRQILNIILTVFIAGGFVSIIATFSYGDPFLEVIHDADAMNSLVSSLSVVIAFLLLFFLNRWERTGALAGWLFVFSLIGITSISDIPSELVVGRGLILWTLPIWQAVLSCRHSRSSWLPPWCLLQTYTSQPRCCVCQPIHTPSPFILCWRL
jgi:hypothetical protein